MPNVTSDVLATIKSEIKALPEFGGLIARLIDEVRPGTQHSVEKTIFFFQQKLSSFSNRIDPSQVNNEEFSELLKSCLLVIIRSHREEKLRAAANILANLMLRVGDPEKASYEELDHLVRCLDVLSTGAIYVLGAVRHFVNLTPSGIHGNVHLPQLQNALPDIDPSLLMSLVSELRGLNLVRVQDGGIRLPDDSQALIELTPIGERFARRFIEGVS